MSNIILGLMLIILPMFMGIRILLKDKLLRQTIKELVIPVVLWLMFAFGIITIFR